MVICSVILIVCSLSLLPIQPRKSYWKWIEILIIFSCCIFFFYTPGRTEDLYRYYLVMATLRSSSNMSSLLVNTYMQETPAFLLYAKFLSIFPNSFLPVVTGAISLLLYIWVIKKVFSESNEESFGYHWQIVICIMTLLFLVRFLDITGIRNILSASIFSAALYDDLVKHKKTSFIFYIVAALIHSSALLYLIIRALLWIYNKYNKIIVVVIMLAASAIIVNFSSALETLFSLNASTAAIYSRLMLYLNNGSGMQLNQRYRLLYAVMYIFILLIALCYEKGFDYDKKYGKLTDFVVLLIAFSFSFINQRELFNRNRMIIIPIGVLFFGLLLKYVTGAKPFSIIIYRNCKEEFYSKFGATLVYLFWTFSIVYFILVTRSDYFYFNKGFKFSI